MIPAGPTPEQRRRDVRLAWIIVGCSAAATLVLLVVGVWAFSGSIARGADHLATTSSRAPIEARGGRSGDQDAEIDAARSAGAPHSLGELRKRSLDEQAPNDDDEASVRRGNGPRERDDAPPTRRRGPIV